MSRQSRLDRCSWIELPLLSWLTPLISLSNQRSIDDNDLDELSVDDQCSNRFNNNSNWNGTWLTLRQIFIKEILVSLLLVIPLVTSHMIQPLLIRQLIIYFKGQSSFELYVIYLFAIGLSLTGVIQAIVHQQIFFRNSRIGMRVRNHLSILIYNHLLKVNSSSLSEMTSSQILNLLSNDATKFEELSAFVHTPLLIPLESILSFIFVWFYIGLPTLFAYGVFIILIPIQILFSKQFSQLRKRTMKSTDERLQLINELIHGCQIIKMSNWEKAIEQRIHRSRQNEMKHIRQSSLLRSLNISLSFSTLPLVCLSTFLSTWFLNRSLLTEDIFVALAFFVMVRVPLTVTLPNVIEKLSEAIISAKRIDQFMSIETLPTIQQTMSNDNSMNELIRMKNATFQWKSSPTLFQINFKVERGEFIGIKGSVGSGKSTLFNAILNQIKLIDGKFELNTSSISYCPQLPWIYSDTIRANILFGKPMNEQRYKQVIDACCLNIDFEQFGSIGDLLMIADKGGNLSGGQKTRITLARALYVDAQLYLFDDPFSSIDTNLCQYLFEQAIGRQSFLKDKSRIVITHHTQFLNDVDQLWMMNDGHLSHLTIEPSSPIRKQTTTTNQQIDWTLTNNDEIKDENSIIEHEITMNNVVKWKIWLKLLSSPPCGWFGLLVMLILMIVNEVFYDYTNNWLAQWSNQSKEEQEKSFYYAYVYLILIVSTFILSIIRIVFSYYQLLNGSTYFHNKMIKGLLNSYLSFFERNPSGRILNRSSKDQQMLDQNLSLSLIDMMQYLLMTIGSIVIIGLTNPWVLLILILLIPLVVWLRRFYIRASLEIKQLENVSRSPVYTLFSSSFDGLISIRAFEMESYFVRLFVERIERNSRSYFYLFGTARWFGLRLDLLVSSLTLLTSVLCVVLRNEINPSLAALSITYCISLTGLFQWSIRQSAEVENLLTSAERIFEYGQLKSEKQTNLIQVDRHWPQHGTIQFEHFTFRYRQQLDPVLRNLNFTIESKEKIGIIGRTGSHFLFFLRISNRFFKVLVNLR